MIAKFGVAGKPPAYKGKTNKIFDWLKDLGLNAFEIQCVYGFKIADNLKEYYREHNNKDMFLSIHAPYYINLGSQNADVVEKSKNYLKQGVALAQEIGVERIIFHPGGGHVNTEQGRIDAVKQLIAGINEICSEIDMKNVKFYPEIGGKTSNLGSLDEIIEICKNCEYCFPCIDIAHLHAREFGSIKSKEILREKLQHLKDELPSKFEAVHFHAYTINYNDKGEVKHLAHGENMPTGEEGLPNLSGFVELLKEFNIEPWVVSEAHETQEQGAIYMHEKYLEITM
ncbi:MAG: TIM barrel protein [Clostridia bacterium]|nr:TIM barrel protein [Clostridia bacterium]